MNKFKEGTDYVFICGPSDMEMERLEVAYIVEEIAREVSGHVPIKHYAYEQPGDAWDANAGTWQRQIPPTRDCEVVIILLGEVLGSALPDTFKLSDDFDLPPNVVHPCPDLDTLCADRSDTSGPIPLTGTVYEFLDALQSPDRETPRPKLFVYVKGDRSIEAIGDPPDNRRWGLKEYRNRIIDETRDNLPKLRAQTRHYDQQIAFLARFFDQYLNGKHHPPNIFDDPSYLYEDVDRTLRRHFGAAPIRVDKDPFKRLAYYDVDDADIYFGRQADVNHVLKDLERAARRARAAEYDASEEDHATEQDDVSEVPFLILRGGSGVGKSSFLRAGLAARFERPSFRERRTGARFSACVTSVADLFRADRSGANSDGEDPETEDASPLLALIEQLTDALPELGDACADLTLCSREKRVEMATRKLAQALEERSKRLTEEKGRDTACKFFIALDQFEEVLIRKEDLPAWSPVLRFLWTCARRDLAYVAIAMKREWYSDFDAWMDETDPAIINTQIEHVLRDPDYESIIRDPFALKGLHVDRRLTEAIRDEVAQYDYVPMPLLSTTLTRLYNDYQEKRRDHERETARNPMAPPFTKILDFETYQKEARLAAAIEELGRAVNKTVQQTRLGEADDLLGLILRRLVRLDKREDGEFRLALRRYPARQMPEQTRPMVDALKRHWLLKEEDGELRLLHESVITHWPKAQEWRKEEETHLKTVSQVSPLIDPWLANPSAVGAGATLSPFYLLDDAERMLVAFRDDSLVTDDMRRFILDAMRHHARKGSWTQDDGRPRLVDAIRLRETDLVRDLLEAGADANARTPADTDEWGHSIGRSTPLMFAASEADVGQVKLLLKHGADPHLTNQTGLGALDYAASDSDIEERENQLETIQLLHEEGGRFTPGTETQRTALCWASTQGNADVVRLLLKLGVDPDESGTDGWPAIIIAADSGYTDVVRILVREGAAVDRARELSGWTSLHAAARNGHLGVVQYLLEQGASVNQTDDSGDSPLIAAVKAEHTEVVRTLLEHGADPNESGANDWPAIIIAADNGYIDVVRILVREGAAVDRARESTGWTSLHAAARSGHLDVVQYLLEQEASVNQTDALGNSALEEAAKAGHTEVVRTLLEHGADPTGKSNKGRSILDRIDSPGVSSNEQEIITLLLAAQFEHAGILPPPWYTVETNGRVRVERLREEELRSVFQEMLEPIDHMDPNTWQIQATFPEQTRLTPPSEAANVLTAAIEYAPASVLLNPETDAFDAVRVTPLSFYPQTRLYEARVTHNNEDKGVVSFLAHPQGYSWLTGTNNEIYRLNEKLPIQFRSDDDVEAYIRFFFTMVHGRHGPFTFLENTDRVQWLKEADKRSREMVSWFAQPIQTESNDGFFGRHGTWTGRGIVQFKDSIFGSKVVVEPSGMLNLVDEALLVENLPVRGETYERGARTLRAFLQLRPPKIHDREDTRGFLRPDAEESFNAWLENQEQQKDEKDSMQEDLGLPGETAENMSKTHAQLAAKLLRDASRFFRDLGEQNPEIEEPMLDNADIYNKIADLVEDDPNGTLSEDEG